MSQVELDTRQPWTPTAQVFKAKIVRAPINFQALMDITVPSMNPDLAFRNIRWQARDNMSLPQVGDDCLVIFDDQREPCVIFWNPVGRNPQIFTGNFSDGPPANPVDDDIWMASVGNGVRWQFQYNADSTSPSKWEFCGGAPACISVGGGAMTGDSVFHSFTNNFLVARTGDYIFDGGYFCTLNAAGQTAFVGPGVNGANAANLGGMTAYGGGVEENIRASYPLLFGIAASAVITLQYWCNGPATFQGGSFTLTPKRVS